MRKSLPVLLATLALMAMACSAPVLRSAAPKNPAVSVPAAANTTTTGTLSGTGALDQFQATLEGIAAAAQPSIVQIQTDQGLGSGIVYDTLGDIVTNNHVVEGAGSLTVKSNDGKTYPGTVVGTFAANDLAVVKVNASALKPARFADVTTVKVGDVVLAVGSPFGLSGTVTEGIVSGLGRTQSEGGNGVVLSGLVQTSAPINPGNSGGALLDLGGAVVGIPTLAGSDSQGRQSSTGIGFAIPSDQVVNAARQIVAGGTVTHTGRPYLGISTRDDQSSGADIVSVVSGGAAARAGLKAGMVIVAIDGKAVADTAGLGQVLGGYKPGDRVAVEVKLGDGSTKSVTVTLGERPAA